MGLRPNNWKESNTEQRAFVLPEPQLENFLFKWTLELNPLLYCWPTAMVFPIECTRKWLCSDIDDHFRSWPRPPPEIPPQGRKFGFGMFPPEEQRESETEWMWSGALIKSSDFLVLVVCIWLLGDTHPHHGVEITNEISSVLAEPVGLFIFLFFNFFHLLFLAVSCNWKFVVKAERRRLPC